MSKDLGRRVKQLRQQNNLTQEELAKMVGYSDKTSITKIELGVVNVKQSTLITLARALNTTPNYLLFGEDVVIEKVQAQPIKLTSKVLNYYQKLTPQNRVNAERYIKYLLSTQEEENGSKNDDDITSATQN